MSDLLHEIDQINDEITDLLEKPVEDVRRGGILLHARLEALVETISAMGDTPEGVAAEAAVRPVVIRLLEVVFGMRAR